MYFKVAVAAVAASIGVGHTEGLKLTTFSFSHADLTNKGMTNEQAFEAALKASLADSTSTLAATLDLDILPSHRRAGDIPKTSGSRRVPEALDLAQTEYIPYKDEGAAGKNGNLKISRDWDNYKNSGLVRTEITDVHVQYQGSTEYLDRINIFDIEVTTGREKEKLQLAEGAWLEFKRDYVVGEGTPWETKLRSKGDIVQFSHFASSNANFPPVLPNSDGEYVVRLRPDKMMFDQMIYDTSRTFYRPYRASEKRLSSSLRPREIGLNTLMEYTKVTVAPELAPVGRPVEHPIVIARRVHSPSKTDNVVMAATAPLAAVVSDNIAIGMPVPVGAPKPKASWFGEFLSQMKENISSSLERILGNTNNSVTTGDKKPTTTVAQGIPLATVVA